MQKFKNVIEYMYYIVGKETNQANIQILLMVQARSTSSSSSFSVCIVKTALSTCSVGLRRLKSYFHNICFNSRGQKSDVVHV